MRSTRDEKVSSDSNGGSEREARVAAIRKRLDELNAANWVLSVRREGQTIVVDPLTVEGYMDALGPAPTSDNPAVMEVMWTRMAHRD